jgi:hypothetical protein
MEKTELEQTLYNLNGTLMILNRNLDRLAKKLEEK